MDKIFMVVALAVLGALLGSFVGAQVWRLRARQLVDDKKQGERVDESELRRIHHIIRPARSDRSECLHCHHQLAWYDLIPIVSWLSLGGRCRYCRHPIGRMEPLLEVGLALVFVVSYLAWPISLMTSYGLGSFTLWLLACTVMALLFTYDAKWYLLPFSVNLTLIGIGAAVAIYRLTYDGVNGAVLVSLLLAVAILSGIYFIFSLFAWVGLGDSILGLGLALLVGKWELAFLAVFLANLIGCFMLIPLALQRKLHRGVHIPFGPFLILGTFISMLWGPDIIRLVFESSDSLLNLLMV